MNYHHLKYFREVCRAGGILRASERLRVAPSAISVQIRSLEDSLGVPLFDRSQKKLELTEAGRIALDQAEVIFRAGEDLVDVLRGAPSARKILHIGSVATLSRNFQIQFLRPLLRDESVELVVRTGSLRDMLVQLKAHTLDILLSNVAVTGDAGKNWHSHLVDEQDASLVGRPPKKRRFRFPEDLDGARIVLPGGDSNLRQTFDALLSRAGVRPVIVAEIDDMAMLRLFAREGSALALVPRVVVADELRGRVLVEYSRIHDIRETFYAITPGRRYQNPLVQILLGHGRGPVTAPGVGRDG